MNTQRLLPSLAGLALTVGVHTSGHAATQSSTVIPGFKGRVQPALSGGSKIKKVYVDTANPESSLASGLNQIESATVNCPGKSTCTFLMTVMDEIGNSSTSSACWAIVVYVDGTAVDGGPCDQVVANTNEMRTWIGATTGITPGSHTITLDTYLGAGTAKQYVWAVRYEVAVP